MRYALRRSELRCTAFFLAEAVLPYRRMKTPPCLSSQRIRTKENSGGSCPRCDGVCSAAKLPSWGTYTVPAVYNLTGLARKVTAASGGRCLSRISRVSPVMPSACGRNVFYHLGSRIYYKSPWACLSTGDRLRACRPLFVCPSTLPPHVSVTGVFDAVLRFPAAYRLGYFHPRHTVHEMKRQT